jgi:alpha-mannosidase
MTSKQAEEHLDVRVVVHTHWDREWYQPEPRFRQRLVTLVDELLDRGTRAPFLLDGQAVLLEDYLSVRPERAADLSAALRAGAIEAGPWFVLADELVPGAEGLVRNLLAGRRVLQALRAKAPDVLYCPDAFGHPACLPTLASGFGFATIVLWRGYGGRCHPARDTVRWLAPDGSSAVVYHLPPDGYEFGSHLPTDPGEAASRWQRIRTTLVARSTSGLVLLTAGADHHAPQQHLDEAIDMLALAATPHRVRRESLAGFGNAIVGQSANRELPVVTGELRDSYGYAWTLQGTFGARSRLKRSYARAERILVRDVEPWVALASLRDGHDRRHLLRAAWRPLLLCQPHDTLCGTAVDEVALAFSQRLDECRSAADELREGAIHKLVGHDADAARSGRDSWRPAVLLRNPTPRKRSGVAEIDLDIVLADSPVGPSSAGVPVSPRRAGTISIGDPAIPVQEVSRSRTFVREESPRGYPRNLLVERRRVVAWIDDVPAHGLVTRPVRGASRARSQPPATVTGDEASISSGTLSVHAAADGLVLEAGGQRIEDWIRFEAEGERGDLYTGSIIPNTHVRASLRKARVTARGPLRAELIADWQLSIPARRLTNAAGEPRRIPQASLRVRTTVRLDAGASHATVLVQGINRATDARLRLVFRTNLVDAEVYADASFGPVHRTAAGSAPGGTSPERRPPTGPLHRYVTLDSAGGGATVISDGLPEVECRPDGSVAVTIFRAVGELSRHDLPERPGHAGYPVTTPAAQEQGPFEARLGFAPHGPRSEAIVDEIEQLADSVLHPLTGQTWRSAIEPPARVDGIALSGDGLSCSAIKQSEDGEWMVLRCVNLLDRTVRGRWLLDGIDEACLARLDETPLGALDVQAGVVEFEAPARAVVTVLAR